MPHFGMPTLIETNSIDECASLAKELKLDFIEINMNMPEYQLDMIDIEHFKSLSKQFSIYYTIHLDENLNFCDFNPYVANAYLKTVADTIKLAKQLDVPVLNMHLSDGVYFTLPDKRVFLFEQYCEHYLKAVDKFIRMCETEIGESDIRICIENSNGFKNFHRKALEIMLKSPVFALTYDVGHDHGLCGSDGEFVFENTDKLQHIHLHDAVGKNHHLALGNGEINVPRYLDIAKQNNCSIVIETKTVESLKQSVKWLKDKKYYEC